jgi:hypothetical protein
MVRCRIAGSCPLSTDQRHTACTLVSGVDIDHQRAGILLHTLQLRRLPVQLPLALSLSALLNLLISSLSFNCGDGLDKEWSSWMARG